MSKNSALILVLSVTALVSIGMVMLFSTGAFAHDAHGDAYFFIKRQAVYLGVGIVACIGATLIDYHLWAKLWLLIFVAAAGLLALCFVPHIGLKVHGSARWVHVGPAMFQPSEIGKFAAVVALAWWFNRHEQRSASLLHGFIFPMLLVGVLMGLIVREEDLGATLLIGVTMIIIMFVAGSNPLYMAILALAVVGGILFLATHMSERMGRINAFMHLEEHKDGKGLQQWEALKAFGSGGLYGLGLGESREKIGYLPFAHTDFIFPHRGRRTWIARHPPDYLHVPGGDLERHHDCHASAGSLRDVARLRADHQHCAPGFRQHRYDNRVAAEQRDAPAFHQLRRFEPVPLSAVYGRVAEYLSPRVVARSRRGDEYQSAPGQGDATPVVAFGHRSSESRRFIHGNACPAPRSSPEDPVMKVVIACGGTGGHLFPGLAVAEVLQGRGHEAMIFISEKEIDSLAVRDHVGRFHFEKLPSVGMPRLLSPAMIGFTRGLAASLTRCRRIYRQFSPDAILGMGGFTSTAPMLSGRLLGVPSFVHESNAIPGKANRLNARLAKAVLLGFAECAKHFPAGTACEVTGTPIRDSLRERPDAKAVRALFGLSPQDDLRTVLVMGGSQGAHGVNQAVLRALPAWKDRLQVIHLTGKDDENTARDAYARAGIPAYVAAFHHRMQEAYSAADFAIARSGAASLSELAFFGLPSLLIPFPAAAEDHQTLNARIFTDAGAALSLSENLADAEALASTVLGVVRNPEKLADMGARARQLSPADAATRVVEAIEKRCHP